MSEISFYCQYRNKVFYDYHTFCPAIGCKKRIKICALVKQIKKGQAKVKEYAQKERKIKNKNFKCAYCEFTDMFRLPVERHLMLMSGVKGHPKMTWEKQGNKKVLVQLEEIKA